MIGADDLYDLTKVLILAASIFGLGVASGAILCAALDVRAMGASGRNGRAMLYTRGRLSMSALALAGHLAFIHFAWSLIANPSTAPSVDGAIRITLVAIAATVFALGSLLMLVISGKIRRSR